MKSRLPRQNKKGPDMLLLPSNAKQAMEGSHSNRIHFSFLYLNLSHDKFNIDSKETHYFRKLLDRLKNVSGMEKGQLMGYTNTGYSSQTLRCHPIKWEDTTENGFGIPNEDAIVDIPRQFSLSANEHGRVHGFFIENVFYVVWLDPDHKLYK